MSILIYLSDEVTYTYQLKCLQNILQIYCIIDSRQLLEKGDLVAQELVNSLQVLEVTTGAMAQELISLVGEYAPLHLQPCVH